jgi:PTS system galactitol-specific IIB component
MKKILVACGTGICTSTMAAKKLETQLESRGLAGKFTISQCKVSELAFKANDFDVIVCTSNAAGSFDTPVIQGLAYLTGVQMDKTTDKVVEALGL